MAPPLGHPGLPFDGDAVKVLLRLFSTLAERFDLIPAPGRVDANDRRHQRYCWSFEVGAYRYEIWWDCAPNSQWADQPYRVIHFRGYRMGTDTEPEAAMGQRSLWSWTTTQGPQTFQRNIDTLLQMIATQYQDYADAVCL